MPVPRREAAAGVVAVLVVLASLGTAVGPAVAVPDGADGAERGAADPGGLDGRSAPGSSPARAMAASGAISIAVEATDGRSLDGDWQVVHDGSVVDTGTGSRTVGDLAPGEYTVTATAPGYATRSAVVDVEAGTTTPVALELPQQHVDAAIVDESFEMLTTGSVGPGDEVSARVAVENTGNHEFSFFVGYSVRDRHGDYHSNDGTTGSWVTLDAGETDWVTVTWTANQYVPGGSYDAGAAVWYDFPQPGERPLDRSELLHDVVTLHHDGNTVPDRARSVFESVLEDDEYAVALEPVVVDGTRYMPAVVAPSSSIYVRDTSTRVARNDLAMNSLLDRSFWREEQHRTVVVVRLSESGADLVTDHAIVSRVMQAMVTSSWADIRNPVEANQWAVGFHDATFSGTFMQAFFALDEFGHYLQTDEDRFEAALTSIVTERKEYRFVPEPIRDEIAAADTVQGAASKAIDIADRIEAGETVVANANLLSTSSRYDSELAERALRKFGGHLTTLQENSDKVGAASTVTSAFLSFVLTMSEQSVYEERSIRELQRVQWYADNHSGVSLDPAMDAAITNVVDQHGDSDAKFDDALHEWVETEGVTATLELSAIAGKKAAAAGAKRFASWLATNYGPRATAKYAGVAAKAGAALSLAGAALSGWTLGTMISNSDGIYTAMKRAEYSLYAMENFTAVKRHVLRTDAAAVKGVNEPVDADVTRPYRSAAYLQHLSLAEFYLQESAAMNATWWDESIDVGASVLDTLKHGFKDGYELRDADHAAEKQRFLVSEAKSHRKRANRFYVDAIVEEALANYPDGGGNVAPDKPASPNPVDGASGLDTGTDLVWSGGDPDGDDVTYDVYLDAGTSNPQTKVAAGVSSTSVSPTLEAGVQYAWKVVATDEHGATTTSSTWTFATSASGNHLPSVSNPQPTDGADGVSWGTALAWTGTDDDGDDLTYDVYLGTGSDPPFYDTTTSSSLSVDGLDQDTRYHWYVVASDGKTAIQSPTWSFRTASGSGSLSLSDFNVEELVIENGGHSPFETGYVNYDISIQNVDGIDDYDVRVVDVDRGIVLGTTQDNRFGPERFRMSLEQALFREPGDHTVKVIAHHAGSDDTVTATATAHVDLEHDSDRATVLPLYPRPGETVSIDVGHITQDSGGTSIEGYNWLVWEGDPDDGQVTAVIGPPGPNQDSVSFTPSQAGEYGFKVSDTADSWLIDDSPVWVYADGEYEPDLRFPSNPLDVPSTATQGDTIRPTLHMRNYGREDANYLVRFKVNGRTVEIEAADARARESDETYDDRDESVSFGLPVGTHTVTAEVIDGHNRKHTFSETVTVVSNDAPNRPSSPSPGNRSSGVGTGATLSWSGGDPDGDSVEYELYLEKGTPYPDRKVGTTSSTSFAPGSLDHDSTYYWRVVATDEHGRTVHSDVWRFETEPAANSEPVARLSASADEVAVGGAVTLDASRSTDADGDSLTYDWSVTSAPPDASVSLPSGPSGEVTVPEPGTYEFRVAVSDGRATNGTTVAVRTEPPDVTLDLTSPTGETPATVDAGSPATVAVETALTVRGGGVTRSEVEAAVEDLGAAVPASVSVGNRPGSVSAVDAGPVTAEGDSWLVPVTLDVTPPGASAGHHDLEVAFVLPSSCWPRDASTCEAVVEYVFDRADGALHYEADGGGSNAPPTARAAANPSSVAPGGTVTLDASASTDPDGDALSYEWRVASAPAGASVEPPDGATGDVTLPEPGTYGFAVTVSDGTESDEAETTVTVPADGAGSAPPPELESVTPAAGAVAYLSEEATVSAAANGTRAAPARLVVLVRSQFTTFTHRVAATDASTATATLVPGDLAGDGNYSVTAVAVGDDDRVDALAGGTLVVDTRPPTVSAAVDANVTDDAATVRVRADEPLETTPTVTVHRPDDSTVAPSLSPAGHGYDGSFDLAGNGTYRVEVTGRDRAGNERTAVATTRVQPLSFDDGTANVTEDGTGASVTFNASATGTEYASVTVSDAPPEALPDGDVAVRFVQVELSPGLEGTLTNATVAIPVDESDLPEGLSPADVSLVHYDEGNASYERVPTRVLARTVGGETRRFYVANVEEFSTYGAVAADTAPPTITGVAPGDVSLAADTSEVTVTVQYADAQSGVDVGGVTVTVDGRSVTGDATNTSITSAAASHTLAGLAPGEYEVTVTVPDLAGNAASETVELVVGEGSDDAGSVGGGGTGGGGADPTVSKLLPERTAAGVSVRVINGLPARAGRTVLPDGVGTASATYTELAIRFAEPSGNFVVDLRPTDDRPAGTPPFEGGRPLTYLVVDADVPDATIRTATVRVRMPADALPAGVDLDDVAAFRYRDGAWRPADASRRGDRFRVRTEGLSTVVLAVARADVSVSGATLGSPTVAAGESVRVTATVENAGTADGEASVELTLDGETVATERVAVPAGGTGTVAFAVSPETPGSYEVAVGGASAGTLVVEPVEDATDDGEGADGAGDAADDESPGETTAGGQPGFGPAAAALAFALVAGLLARRRRRT